MILCYHKVYTVPKTAWWLSVDAFYRQMAALRSRKVVFLDEYDSSNPDHVVITFDGVYDNVLQFAVPVLEHFGYPFELFIIGDYIGLENVFDQVVEPPCHFADLEALDEMIGRGGRIQWHTRTHKRFSDLDIVGHERELTVPTELANRFGAPHLRWFAYPHGAVGDDSRALVRERFVGALACDDGDVADLYYLPRRLVFEDHDFFKGRVSAIVANYNYGRFLADAIDSLECQSVAPDEILIIDDASTDDSSEVLDWLESRGYRVERNSTNIGIVENFRKAVLLTSGDYVFFLGADNRLRRDFVLECRVALDSDARAAVAYTDMLLWGVRASELARSVGAAKIGRSQTENWDVFHWRVTDPTPDALSRFEIQNFVHGSSMYRRSFYEAVGGYRKSDGPEDHHLFYRMWSAGGGLAHVPLPVLEYRQHSAAQANTTLGLQMQARWLRERASVLTHELEEMRANRLRQLDVERSLAHSLMGTMHELLAQLSHIRDKSGRALEERIRQGEEMKASLDALWAQAVCLEAELKNFGRRLVTEVSPNDLVSNQYKGSGDLAEPTILSDRILFGDLEIMLLTDNSASLAERDDVYYMMKSYPYIDSYRQVRALFDATGARNVMEVGVFRGGSAPFLHRFFQANRLVCVDHVAAAPPLDRYAQQVAPIVRVHYNIDQGDKSALKLIIEKDFDEPIDLVVDDASHMYGLTKDTFEAVFPYVRSGGVYVIETWNWSHDAQSQLADHYWADQDSPSNLVFQLIAAYGASNGLISSVGFAPGLMWVIKSWADLPKSNFGLDAYTGLRGRKLGVI